MSDRASAQSRLPKQRRWLALVGFLALSFVGALPGAAFPPGEWYAELSKPSWTPPSWVFGPAWTTLYCMMGVAAWLVWRERGLRSRELGAWGVQLALNALWTPLFFGLRRPDLAFVEIVLLWLAVAATLTLFLRARRLAGLLLVPYLAWVSFAAALNAALWSAN